MNPNNINSQGLEFNINVKKPGEDSRQSPTFGGGSVNKHQLNEAM